MIGVSTNILPDSARKMKYYASNGKSVDFQGSDDGFTVADDDDFSMTDGSNTDKPFSLSMWIKQDISGTANTANGLLIGKGTTTFTKEWKLFLHYGQLMFDIIDNADAHYKRVSAAAQTINNPHNTWYHIVATYDGSESSSGMKLYRDGLDINADSGGGGTYVGLSNTSSVVAIGHRLDNENYDFDGHMKDICIWKDYELSQAEVSAMYNDGEFSVDPTVDQGVYDGASYLKLWLKCEDSLEIQAAASTTLYQEHEEEPNIPEGGSVLEIGSGHGEFGNCPDRGGTCYRVIDPNGTPQILGTTDSSSNNHHASNTGDGVSIVTDSPTATSIDNEY